MRMRILAGAALAAMLASPAMGQGSCLRMDRIYNWQAPNNTSMIVEDISHQKFKLTLMGPCINLNFKEGVAFKSIGGTWLDCLTKGDEVVIRYLGQPEHCPIVSVVPYTPAMQKADQAAAAAKAKSGQ